MIDLPCLKPHWQEPICLLTNGFNLSRSTLDRILYTIVSRLMPRYLLQIVASAFLSTGQSKLRRQSLGMLSSDHILQRKWCMQLTSSSPFHCIYNDVLLGCNNTNDNDPNRSCRDTLVTFSLILILAGLQSFFWSATSPFRGYMSAFIFFASSLIS